MKKIASILILFVSITAFSQTKTGTVDIDYIISQMPGLAQVQDSINAYGAGLDADLKQKTDEYKALIATYQEKEASFSDAEKKEKQSEIIALENDITKFRQNGAQLIAIKRDEAMRPLYQKIAGALEKVAKAQGYTQVLSLNEGDVVYFDENHDISLAVLKELGITPTQQ
ncbi:OmpH family outer membrane protein [Luteirhabdus pelagi]|uniref:OmpH family outer membrane protein n=1 Tax=Luteirhabdus pelagi TaxID=2792783 RepID=UPI00193AD45B|nr:OmpH family outer membrane protein [Luteirhabdus pelagi]